MERRESEIEANFFEMRDKLAPSPALCRQGNVASIKTLPPPPSQMRYIINLVLVRTLVVIEIEHP